MKNYEKPVILGTEETAEGVYMASGSDCYTVTARITQTPETGRPNYCVHLDSRHDASDKHHSGEQILTLTFNQSVGYVSSNGQLVSGDGTNMLEIKYNYHSNAQDNIGLGDVYVTAGVGLADPSAVLSCDYACAYGHV